jgi:hypothetical protein
MSVSKCGQGAAHNAISRGHCSEAEIQYYAHTCMKNIALKVAHINNAITSLNADQTAVTSESNLIMVNEVIMNNIASILFEEIFSSLDAYARSLSAMYLTNFKFSNEFTNALRSFASDKDKNEAFLSTAMHFELTNFENIALNS